MEYKLGIGQKEIQVEVEPGENRRLKINVDRKPYDVEYSLVGDHQIHMAVNDGGGARQVNAFAAETAGGRIIVINGRHYHICDLEARNNKTGKEIGPEIPDRITPPMPSVVVKIPVQVGDQVKKGQGVIVVSAMKMETTLYAPYDGTVTKINAAVNDKVAPGQILVEIEKEGA